MTLCATDVNMCEADLHHCPEHSVCVHNGRHTNTSLVVLAVVIIVVVLLLLLLSVLPGPAAYYCKCEEGRATKKCILRCVGAVS